MTKTAADRLFIQDASRNVRQLVPGFYPGIDAETYHSLPAASASILKRALEECPRAGWFESWLNPDRIEETSDIMDVGTIVHSVLLEGDYRKIALIDPELYPSSTKGGIPTGWTNNAIRAARDAARENGLIPILPPDMIIIEAIVESARTFIESLRATEPAIWQAMQPDGGVSESSLVWTDPKTNELCRIRPDRFSNSRDIMIDLKTTGTSANPESFARQMIPRMSSWMRAAFYKRGVDQAFKTKSQYFFLVVETEPPYLCSLIGVGEEEIQFGMDKVEFALQLWHDCSVRQFWPAYPNRVVWPQIPAYEQTRWEEQRAGHTYHYEQMFGERKS